MDRENKVNRLLEKSVDWMGAFGVKNPFRKRNSLRQRTMKFWSKYRGR